MASMTVTIIETLSDNRFVLYCARCGSTGRGYYSNGQQSTEPCKVCDGRGVLLVKLNSNSELSFVRCARCEGTGRGYYSNAEHSTEPCKACGGAGAQPIRGTITILT